MITNDHRAEIDQRPGVRLGLPATGPGAVAGTGRRLLGLAIDIAASFVIAALLTRKTTDGYPTPGGWATLVFVAETVVLLCVAGQTIGMFAVKVQVVTLAGNRITLWWALIRTALLLCLIPALVWDSDRRGLHDKASGVVVINR